MGRSRRGSGSVFQRTYRDAKRKNRKTANWYIEFVAGNRTIREATDFTNRTDAAEFLKKRMSDALGGKIVLSRNVMYDDLRELIITDYTNNGRKSLGDLKTTRLPAARWRVRGHEGDRHHDDIGRALQDASIEGEGGAGDREPRTRVVEAYVQARTASGHGGDYAVHLHAGRAQRAEGLLRA
jgi:hypothetical protein